MVYSSDKLRESVVKNLGGEVLSTNEISVGGAPGFELKVLIKGGEGAESLPCVRQFIIGRRVYSLKHFVIKPLDSPAVAEKAIKFFNSFKVVEGG
jgi:hypothetical protein